MGAASTLVATSEPIHLNSIQVIVTAIPNPAPAALVRAWGARVASRPRSRVSTSAAGPGRLKWDVAALYRSQAMSPPRPRQPLCLGRAPIGLPQAAVEDGLGSVQRQVDVCLVVRRTSG